ncbi:hypothetical protein DM860_009914 [Cuscuta australis]|uniref:Uncharacterized protein n=1 Tax=Cuscuta australis TaxID=267555 RepID=A0A328DBA8_9ASTE|nr:hypothetical protein DM860_009914 [Cuscuta australis]
MTLLRIGGGRHSLFSSPFSSPSSCCNSPLAWSFLRHCAPEIHITKLSYTVFTVSPLHFSAARKKKKKKEKQEKHEFKGLRKLDICRLRLRVAGKRNLFVM